MAKASALAKLASFAWVVACDRTEAKGVEDNPAPQYRPPIAQESNRDRALVQKSRTLIDTAEGVEEVIETAGTRTSKGGSW